MLAEQGVAPGVLAYATRTLGRLGPPPAPIRLMGAALDGWNGQDEGQRKCRLDRGEGRLVCLGPEERARAERRYRGAPEGARAGHTARGRLRKVSSCYAAPHRRSAPSFEGKETKTTGARAPQITPEGGPMPAALGPGHAPAGRVRSVA